MKAFKGFDVNESGQFICIDMVYEPGKTYKYDDQIELCKKGYHACEKFEDVLVYYPYEKGQTKYYEVECNGDIIKSVNDSKFVCSEITLLEESHGWWEEYDYVGNFVNGFAPVTLNNKWNCINIEGKLVSNTWFDIVGYFVNGLARVYLNGKYNFINKEGNLVFNQWFDNVDDFHEGFAPVKLNGKHNFISQEGKLVSSQWFDYVGFFREGFARVYLNDTEYKLDKEGNLHDK